MTLAELPVEVLGLILSFGLSLDVLGLWKSGNRLLISKLSKGGVKRIVLEHADPLFEPRLPKCLAQFDKLEELTISSISLSLGSVETLRSELKQTSRNLRVLSLRILHAEEVLLGSKVDVASPPSLPVDDEPLAAKPSKEVETAAADLSREEKWNLDAIWPRLEELCLSHSLAGYNDLETSRTFPLTLECFGLLPRSLLKLEIPTFSSSSAAHLAWLPPNLEKLFLPRTIDAEGISLVPPSITDLGHSLSEEAHMALTKDPSLLPNLKVFSAGENFRGYRRSLEWILSLEGRWPNTIEKLELHNCKANLVFGEETRPLPRNLKRLVAVTKRAGPVLYAAWILRLPPFLAHLHVCAIDWTGITASIWPSTLRSLIIMDTKFGPQNFHQLPRSLTSLDTTSFAPGRILFSTSEDTFENSACCEFGRACLSGLDKDLWSQLKLEVISGSLRRTGSYPSVVALIEAIESGRLYGLPLGLLELIMSKHVHYDEYTLVVPPRVRQLKVPSVVAGRPGFLELLPPTITDLDTGFPQYCDEANVRNTTTTLSTFNEHLQTLTIRGPAEVDAPLALLCVPSTLRTLIFIDGSHTAWVTNDHLQALPPRLTRLEIEANADSSENWLDLIPRTVTHLSTPHLLLGSEFCKLPPHMEILTIGWKLVGLADFWTLPSSLKKLERWRRITRTKFQNFLGLMDDTEDFGSPVELDGDGFLSEADVAFLKERYRSICRMFKRYDLEDVEKVLDESRHQRRTDMPQRTPTAIWFDTIVQ